MLLLQFITEPSVLYIWNLVIFSHSKVPVQPKGSLQKVTIPHLRGTVLRNTQQRLETCRLLVNTPFSFPLKSKFKPYKASQNICYLCECRVGGFQYIAPEKSSPYYQILQWELYFKKWCVVLLRRPFSFSSNSQSLAGLIQLDPKSSFTGSTELPFFRCPAAENPLFPQQPLSLAHDSSHTWQLCSSIFQEGTVISPRLERRMGTVCSGSCRGGTSWAWILLLQMHNFGPAHVICGSGGVSLHFSTRCTLNTNCFLLLPEYCTCWCSVYVLGFRRELGEVMF